MVIIKQNRTKSIDSGYVYVVKCLNSQVFYIGSSACFENILTYTGSARSWIEHKNKYERNTFIKCVLVELDSCTKSELFSCEEKWCNYWIEIYGLDSLPFNDGFGHKQGLLAKTKSSISNVNQTRTDATKRNISNSLIGEKHPMYNTRNSIETRKKKSLANLGKPSKKAKLISIYGITFEHLAHASTILLIHQSKLYRLLKTDDIKFVMYIYL